MRSVRVYLLRVAPELRPIYTCCVDVRTVWLVSLEAQLAVAGASFQRQLKLTVFNSGPLFICSFRTGHGRCPARGRCPAGTVHGHRRGGAHGRRPRGSS